MSSENSAYAVLGLSKGASEKDVKLAYVNLVKKFDPEKHTERFMVIQAAYDKLRQTKLRAKEDAFTYNVIRGEYLFNADEKCVEGKMPKEDEVAQARAAYRENAGDEAARQQICRVLFRRSHYSVSRKQLSDAIRDWTEVLEVEPSHIRARHNLGLASSVLGVSYAMHGLHEEAIELWEKALQLDPDSTDLIHNLALVAEKAKDPARAGRYWAETVNRWKLRLEKESDNEYLRQLIVEALNHHGSYAEASPTPKALSAGTESSPPSAPRPAMNSNSNVPKVPAGSSPSPSTTPAPSLSVGIDRYREIAKLKPDDFDAQYQLCNKLMEERQWEEAVQELTLLARKHPKNTEVLNLMGWALLNKGKKDEAFGAWKRSLLLDPKNTSTREQLVRAHLSMGKNFREKGLFTHALVHFKHLLALMPKSAEVHLEIAGTYDMKGDVRSAAQEYNAVLAIDPKNKVARKALNDLRLKR